MAGSLIPSYLQQSSFDVRFEWGMNGIECLCSADVIVIVVDVLSFSTCVDVAVSRGGILFPYRWKDDTAIRYAASLNAELAGPRGGTERFSLSPVSMLNLQAETRVVLASPNGGELSSAAKDRARLLVAGSLRNCQAVARFAASVGYPIVVIGAGERWPDRSLRPAVEDLIGAGSIIAQLQGEKSPEALAAEAAWKTAEAVLEEFLLSCGSGRELIERGYRDDVLLAGQWNVSSAVPVLRGQGFINVIQP